LQSRRQVGDVAEDRPLVADALAHQIAGHHGSGRNPNARREEYAGSGLERGHGFDDAEPRVHRPRGVVLVRQGVAEVDQEPVAQGFGDVAVGARDDLRARVLERLNHVTEILGVELRRELRRTDQVAEHNRELATFGLPCVGARSRRRCGRYRGDFPACRRLQDPAAIAKRNAELF
jgi:hypothetical protein